MRRGPGPTAGEVQSRGPELRERYGLKHFELLDVNDRATRYTALLRVSMTEGMGEIFRLLGSDILPTRPFRFLRESTLVSFYATESQLRKVRGLMSRLGVTYAVTRSRRVAGIDLQPLGNLTERQKHMLQLAHRLGYYGSPAGTKLAHLAEIAGVSKAAVSKQLRAAERKILDHLLGAGEGGGEPR